MSSHKAPTGYQPTGQGAADQGYQANTNYLSSVGQQLSSSVIPQLQGITSAVQNNPYYTQAQTGADNAAQIGANFVAPSQFYGAGQDLNLADTAAGAAGGALQTGQDAYANLNIREGNAARRANQAYDQTLAYLPQIMASYGKAPDLMTNANASVSQENQLLPYIQQQLQRAGVAYDQQQALLPYLLQGLGPAGDILQTGFDPQRQLYDRSYQQNSERTNAIAAQQGVSGSPFAAGLAADSSRNFDMDWQNNQLSRQVQALGAFDQASSTAAGNYNTIMGGGGAYQAMLDSGVSNMRGLTGDTNSILFNAQQGQFSDQQQSMRDAVANYTSMLGAGSSAYGTGMGIAQGFGQQAQQALNSGYGNFANLSGAAQAGYQNASDLGAAGLNTLTTAAMYPNQVYMNNQQQILDAIQAQIQGTNASMGLTQDSINDYGQYMKIGQSATQLAQNATSINNAASAATWKGIGQLAGLALAPFTGGASLLATGAGAAGSGNPGPVPPGGG